MNKAAPPDRTLAPHFATAAPQAPLSLPPSLLQSELRRIAASAAFRNSPRHRRFLEYLVAHAVKGEGARLKEMTLGIEVFDRRPSNFDPQRDTIVRVETRRLRSRLERYYREEGRRSLIEIELPVGSYVPLIRRRAASDAGTATSLAILPIANAGGDAQFDSLCDDLTDNLIDAVARLPGIKVIAHHSVFHFRDPHPAPESLRAIAATLGVGLLLRGSLTSGDAALRLKLKLFRTRDAETIWSDAWVFAKRGDFAARDALIARVVDALHGRFGEHDGVSGAAPMTPPALPASPLASSDPQVRDLVDRGRYLMRQSNPDAYAQALARFRQAVAIDPQCAAAHFGIARVQTHRVAMTLVAPVEAVAEAKSAALCALALDPELGEAESLLAALSLRYDYDWTTAQAGYLAAIDRAPGAPYVHVNYAFGLMLTGRFDAAKAELALARELDPLDVGLRAMRALLDLYRRDYARAEAQLNAVLDIEPQHLLTHALLGALHLYRAMPDAALAAYRKAQTVAPHLSIGAVGIAQALALRGEHDAARATRDELCERFRDRYLSPYQLALIALRLAELDEALDQLETAASERDPNFICVLVDPAFDTLRDAPRFIELIASCGLDRALVMSS